MCRDAAFILVCERLNINHKNLHPDDAAHIKGKIQKKYGNWVSNHSKKYLAGLEPAGANAVMSHSWRQMLYAYRVDHPLNDLRGKDYNATVEATVKVLKEASMGSTLSV